MQEKKCTFTLQDSLHVQNILKLIYTLIEADYKGSHCLDDDDVFVLMGWSLLPNTQRHFKIYCAPPNLGITRT